MRLSSSRRTPDPGFSSPATSRSKVDLPQPDGPSSATNSPGSIDQTDVFEHRKRGAVDIEGMADMLDIERGAGRRIGDGLCRSLRYHLTTPFCQTSKRSRVRNSSVMAPEHNSDITISAAYMLA